MKAVAIATTLVALVLGSASLFGDSVEDLAAAKSFAFGGIGAAGTMSHGERDLRAILQRKDAAEQLQGALAHASLEGQLYILVGLRRCALDRYREVVRTLARPKDEVEVIGGCMIRRESFREVVSQIEAGRFDDSLSRPAW